MFIRTPAPTTNNKELEAEQALLSIKKVVQSGTDKTLLTDEQFLEEIAEIVGKVKPHQKAHAMAVIQKSKPIKRRLANGEVTKTQLIKNGRVQVLNVKVNNENFQIHLDPNTHIDKGSIVLLDIVNNVPKYVKTAKHPTINGEIVSQQFLKGDKVMEIKVKTINQSLRVHIDVKQQKNMELFSKGSVVQLEWKNGVPHYKQTIKVADKYQRTFGIVSALKRIVK